MIDLMFYLLGMPLVIWFVFKGIPEIDRRAMGLMVRETPKKSSHLSDL